MKHLNLNLSKTLSPDSNIVLSSQQAIKSYIDSKKVFVQFLQESAPTTFKTGDKWVNTASNKLFIATNDTTWDNGSNLDITAIYSFGNLLYHYNGTDTKCYSTTSITEQNANKEIKEWFGTQDEYNAIETKDENTHYIIIDDASTSSSLLATQEEFNNSVTDKAATPKQVNEKIGNYLPLAGGNLDKGAILRFTNTNNQVSSMSLDENKYITMSDNLKVSGDINTNSLVSATGNIYKGNSSGATNIWSDSFATTEKAGIVKVGDQLTVAEDGTLNVNTDTLATKTDLAGYLPLSGGKINGILTIDNSIDSKITLKYNGNSCGFLYAYGTSSNPALILGNNTGQVIGITKGSGIYLKRGHDSSASTILCTQDKAVANGVASLDANAKVPVAQIPDLSSTYATINSLATVATSGSYSDLTNKPTIPTVDSALSSTSTNAIQNKVVNTALAGKANATHTHASGDIKGLAKVATSGMYSDLTGTPGVATANTLGLVKPDGTTITVKKDGTISATGGSGSGSGFDFEGTKAEFDAAVAAGTITDDSVSLITDDVSGDTVATKAELQAVDRSKADTNLGNLSTAGKALASGLGMPSSRYTNLTLGASDSTYTAPANGYFCLKGNSEINANFKISFYNQTANFRQTVSDDNWADWVSTYIPAKKGDVVNLLYTNVTTASHNFLFIYAEGEE